MFTRVNAIVGSAVATGLIMSVLLYLLIASDSGAQTHVYPPPSVSSLECTAANQVLTCDASASTAPVDVATNTLFGRRAGNLDDLSGADAWGILGNPTVAIDLDGSSTTDVPGGVAFLIDSVAAPSQWSAANLTDLMDGGISALHSHVYPVQIGASDFSEVFAVAVGTPVISGTWSRPASTPSTVQCWGDCATDTGDAVDVEIEFQTKTGSLIVAKPIPDAQCGNTIAAHVAFELSFATTDLGAGFTGFMAVDLTSAGMASVFGLTCIAK